MNDFIKKDLNISVLLDYYGDLLTVKQKDFLNFYYNEDFSLAEIATNHHISRQSVHDTIKNAQAYLIDFEKKIGLVQILSQLSDVSKNINLLNQTLMSKELALLSQQIENILQTSEERKI